MAANDVHGSSPHQAEPGEIDEATSSRRIAFVSRPFAPREAAAKIGPGVATSSSVAAAHRIRGLALAALVVAAGGCSSADEASSAAETVAEQTSAALALTKTTQSPWRWVQRGGSVKHLATARTGRPVLAANGDVARTTLEMLEESKALFRLRAPTSELAIVRAQRDAYGNRHARFQQLTHGVPVAGAELAAHYDREGRITSIDSTYVPDLEDVDVNPAIDETEARAFALSAAADLTGVDTSRLDVEPSSLVVHAPEGRAAALAYDITVSALAADVPSRWSIIVDAKSGDILHAYDKLQTIAGKGIGVLGDEKTFEVIQSGSGFEMTDSSKKVSVRTLTAEGKKAAGKAVTSPSAFTWDEGVVGAGSAVDAHAHAAIVLSYYQERHGRNGIDGRGGSLLSTVHYGTQYDNAAWNGTGIIIGDGGELFYPPSVNLDVVAHEFTHGVTQHTSALLYENQPGALNEAVSDIFGAFIEHFAHPDDTKNWTIGESALKAGGALRDLSDPGSVALPQPAHMSEYLSTQQDDGGVHANSGIINNAAYLMTVGGTNPVSGVKVAKGIGWEKSEKLWYQANTEHFLKSTDFGQAAQGVLEAARDIDLSEDEVAIVAQAFAATGIIDDPESFTTAAADDEGGGERRSRRKLILSQGSSCSSTGMPRAPSGDVALTVTVGFAFAALRRRKARERRR